MSGLESNLALVLPLVLLVAGGVWGLELLDRWRAEALDDDDDATEADASPPPWIPAPMGLCTFGEDWTIVTPRGVELDLRAGGDWTLQDVLDHVETVEALG